MNKLKQCYMCEKHKTSSEHVPPKCLFPEGSRRNLITVPSCEKHNLKKSCDDEFLKDILGSCLIKGDNNVHQNALNDSIDRSYERNENFRKDILKNTIKVNKGVGYELDRVRLENIFHHIVSGLLFHHHKKRWIGQCQFIFLFIEKDRLLCKDMPLMFEKYTEYGENQEIFKYKITPTASFPDCAIQMTFFNDLKIIGRGKSY